MQHYRNTPSSFFFNVYSTQDTFSHLKKQNNNIVSMDVFGQNKLLGIELMVSVAVACSELPAHSSCSETQGL